MLVPQCHMFNIADLPRHILSTSNCLEEYAASAMHRTEEYRELSVVLLLPGSLGLLLSN